MATFIKNVKRGKTDVSIIDFADVSRDIALKCLTFQLKMPQGRDNAGAVCDSDMGMLFLNHQVLWYRRLLHQKLG